MKLVDEHNPKASWNDDIDFNILSLCICGMPLSNIFTVLFFYLSSVHGKVYNTKLKTVFPYKIGPP